MEIHSVWTFLLALAAGIALSAACGLRAFLPLLAVGLAARFHLYNLSPGLLWLQSGVALTAFGIATVVEIVGDKIPVVDHVLDSIGTVVRPAAAWLGATAVLSQLGQPWSAMLGVVLGTGSLAVHALKAKTRVGSSVATLGAANPVLSFVEDGTTFGLVASAILAPLIALIGVIVLIWLLARVMKRREDAREPIEPVQPPR